jgi:DNA polymerase III delta prime subunit
VSSTLAVTHLHQKLIEPGDIVCRIFQSRPLGEHRLIQQDLRQVREALLVCLLIEALL